MSNLTSSNEALSKTIGYQRFNKSKSTHKILRRHLSVKRLVPVDSSQHLTNC